MLRNQIVLISLLALCSSCSFYRPAAIQSPLLKKKGDIELSGSVGSSTDASLAFSPFEHFGIRASAGTNFGVKYEFTDSSGKVNSKRYLNYQVEGALGYYNSLGRDWQFQTYFGLGRGAGAAKVESELPLWPFSTSEGVYGANYHNQFVQFAFHKRLKKELHFGLVYRLNHLDIGKIDYFNGQRNVAPFDTRSRSFFVDQFALEYRGRRETFGGFVQLQFAGGRKYTSIIDVRGMGIHWGIYILIDEFFKKKKEAPVIDQPFDYENQIGN